MALSPRNTLESTAAERLTLTKSRPKATDRSPLFGTLHKY